MYHKWQVDEVDLAVDADRNALRGEFALLGKFTQDFGHLAHALGNAVDKFS
jgi:hypothetical protein